MSKPIIKLKQYREAAFMSQPELADKAAVSQSVISRAEAGDKIALGSIKKIAKALNVKPEKLI